MAVRNLRKQGKLSRCLKAPFRLLVRAKDFYLQIACPEQVVSSGPVFNHRPTQPANTMPRSSSASSATSTQFDDDYRDLLRAASTRSLRDKAVSDRTVKVWSQKPEMKTTPRSQSVAIGRIDEDAPLIDFGEVVKVKVKHPGVVPRSRTYASHSKMTSLI